MASDADSPGGAPVQRAATKYVTPPIIVNSQPDWDARIQAGMLRCSDNNANLPYFLQVRHDSDWQQIFCGPGWPFPWEWEHKTNPEYSKLVIYHIAAQNQCDVSTQATKLKNRVDPDTLLNAVNYCHPREFFTPEEMHFFSETFLLKVFEYLRWSLSPQNPKDKTAPVANVEPNVPKVLMSKSTTNSPTLKPMKHRRSKSHSTLSREYMPRIMSIDRTNHSKLVEIMPNVNPQHLAVPSSATGPSIVPPSVAPSSVAPPSAAGPSVVPSSTVASATHGAVVHSTASPSVENRRIASEHILAKPTIRGGDRTVSGPPLDLRPATNTGPIMGSRSYAPPTPLGGASQISHMRTLRPIRVSTSQQSTPAPMHIQPIAIPRRDLPPGPHGAHLGQFHSQSVRIPSGETMRFAHQMPGHMFGHPGMPPHPVHHMVMGPPPPPQLNINMPPTGTPMSPMQSGYYDPNMVLQGPRPVSGQEAMLYGADAQQLRQYNSHLPPSQYGPPRQLAHGPGRFGSQGQDMGRLPRQSHPPHGGSTRGRGRKHSGRGRGGMPAYDGGHKNSTLQPMDRPFVGSMLDLVPPGPTGPPVMERNPRRESFSTRESAKPSQPIRETERFPDFHETEEIMSMNLPKEQQCFRKFIGSDVEGMDSLWIGNIAPGTPDQMLRDLIEEYVPVKEFKPVLHGDRQFGWTIVTYVYPGMDTVVLLTRTGFIRPVTPV
jgi:hypothetical protein